MSKSNQFVANSSCKKRCIRVSIEKQKKNVENEYKWLQLKGKTVIQAKWLEEKGGQLSVEFGVFDYIPPPSYSERHSLGLLIPKWVFRLPANGI